MDIGSEDKSATSFTFVLCAGLGLAFLAGNFLQFSSGFSTFWAPVGVGLAALLAAPYSWWPGILVLLGLVDTLAGWHMFGYVTFGDDPVKAGLAALSLRRLDPDRPFRINTLRRFVTLLITCAFWFSLVAFFTAPPGSAWTGFWMGDLLGVTMVVPLVFLQQTPEKRALLVESLLTLTVLFVASRSLFLPPRMAQSFAVEFPYLLFPLLLWVAIRLPDRVVALSTIGVAIICVYLTGRGLGPFLALPVPQEQQLLLLQAYLLVVTTGPVLLSLGLYERKSASSEERQYQGRLQRSHLNYRLLFEASGLAIALLEGRTVVERNRRFDELFAFSPGEDFLSRAVERQPDGRLSREVAEEIHSSSRERVHHTPLRMRSPDSSSVDVELSVFPIPGSELRAVTALDVTESRRLLDMLKAEQDSLATRVEIRSTELRQANAELIRSARAKSEMVAYLSHELTTPLTALIAHTDTLMEGLFGPLAPRQKGATREMRENADRLSRLVLDLLDLHRLEAGKISISAKHFRLGEIVDQVLAGLESTLLRRNVECRVEGEREVSLHLDPRLLKRVLTLLVGRAARQTPPGGSCGVRVESWVELRTATITVWDQGVPLKEATILRARDPYAYHSERDNRLETGVSLAVADGLLELLFGKLEIRGTEHGSLLTVSLPLEAS